MSNGADKNIDQQLNEIAADADGKDDFTEGKRPTEDKNDNDIPDGAEQEAGGAKYESIREAYKAKDGFLSGVGEVIRNTTAGRNAVDRVVGFGLDLFTFFVPAGSKIDRLRKRGKQALNLNKDKNDMKGILKRAFTTDGGGFIRVREDGKLSIEAIGATVIRLALIVGLYYGADALGLNVQEILSLIGLS